MCNSYQQGHCNYYGVDVKEMDYKCYRGQCTNKTQEAHHEILPTVPKKCNADQEI